MAVSRRMRVQLSATRVSNLECSALGWAGLGGVRYWAETHRRECNVRKWGGCFSGADVTSTTLHHRCVNSLEHLLG
jgi:hypothetical protein